MAASNHSSMGSLILKEMTGLNPEVENDTGLEKVRLWSNQ
jgi:hypothetical protein